MAELHPGLLMFVASRHVEMRVMAALGAAGHPITMAQGRVAARIGPHGTRLTELAEQAGITKQSAGFLVDQLERAGYVERVPDPSDARARLVRLAERGREVQRLARREERRIEREWTEHLGEERMGQLRAALTSLREITDPWIDG